MRSKAVMNNMPGDDATLAERAVDFLRSTSLIIAHDSKYLHMWEAFTMILVFYVVFMVPVMIGFRWEPPGSPALLFWVGLLVDVFFLIDVCVNFSTSFLDEATKEVVDDRWRIGQRPSLSEPGARG